MDNEPKIKLKNQNSNSNVINCLEKISNGNLPRVNDRNFRLFSTFSTCLMCILIGICLTPALTQKNNKNVVVRHNQPASASEVKEVVAQNNAKNTKCSSKNSKNKLDGKKPKMKKPKNKSKSTLNLGYLAGDDLLKNQDISKFSSPPYHSNGFGNSVSNVLNGNFLAEEDDWFYYINYNNDGLVYRTNLKSNETELALSVSCDEICVLGNKLYAKCADFCGYLMTYDFFENQYGRVVAGDCFVNVNSKCIISCDDSNIYKSYSDGVCPDKKTIYSGSVSMCVTHDDNIYFVEADNLYSVDIDGENKTLIKENVQTFAIDNSNIYYVSNDKLYCVDNDLALSDISIGAINIYGGVIYFSNVDDAGKLYSMNTDATGIKKLSDFCAEKICVTPHKIAVKTDANRVIILDL